MKPPRYPLNRRLGGTQDRCGRFGEEIDPLLLAGIEPIFLRCPDKTQATMQTTPSDCCMGKLVLGATAPGECRVKTLAAERGGAKVTAVQALEMVPEDKMQECGNHVRNFTLRGPNLHLI